MSPADDFPAYTVHPDRELYRIHRADREPLHFATVDEAGAGGRFDLPASTGHGTCYCSTSLVGAYLETMGRFRVVPEAVVVARRLTVMSPTGGVDHRRRHAIRPSHDFRRDAGGPGYRSVAAVTRGRETGRSARRSARR